MPLLTPRAYFTLTADTNNILSGNNILGSTGRGVYRIWIGCAAAVDGTWTVSDGRSNVIDAMSIPIKAAGSTVAPIEVDRDPYWDVAYVGNADTIPINVVDGTNGEISVLVEYRGPA